MRCITVGVALAALGLVACAAPLDDSASTRSTVAWALESIDGRPLPYAQHYGTAPSRQEVVSGMLLLRPDGTFLMDLTYFIAGPDRPTRSSRVWDGRWHRSGNTFYFDFDNGGQSTAVLVEGGLDMRGERSSFRWAM